MKLACALLLTAFSAATYAEPIHRCQDGTANVSYQDTPCRASTREIAAGDVSFETPEDFVGAWDTGQADPRRLRANQEGLAIAMRVRARQKVSDDRNAVQYAANRSRCADAMRIADVCGKFAGTFYCDAKGFQPIPESERAKRAVLNNSDRYQMELCALKFSPPSQSLPSPPSPAAPAATGPATARSR